MPSTVRFQLLAVAFAVHAAGAPAAQRAGDTAPRLDEKGIAWHDVTTWSIERGHLYGDDSEGATDAPRANDLGFMRQAKVFEPVLRKALQATR